MAQASRTSCTPCMHSLAPTTPSNPGFTKSANINTLGCIVGDDLFVCPQVITRWCVQQICLPWESTKFKHARDLPVFLFPRGFENFGLLYKNFREVFRPFLFPPPPPPKKNVTVFWTVLACFGYILNKLGQNFGPAGLFDLRERVSFWLRGK